MAVYARKWMNEEKEKMAKTAAKVFELMKQDFKNDFAMMAQTMAFVQKGFNDEIGLERIRILDKNLKPDTINEEMRVRQIVEAMKECQLNLVLFRDCPEVWMQFYMGLYLKKPTAVIIERGDTKSIDLLTHYGVHLGIVDDFSEAELKRIMKQIQQEMEGELDGSKRSNKDKP
jgi:hypothetical protein